MKRIWKQVRKIEIERENRKQLKIGDLPSLINMYYKTRGIFVWFQNFDELLLGLASMGFEFEDCQLALEAGNSTLESAVEWYKYVLYTVISQSINEP